MDSSSLFNEYLSPESTVTSLLSSSGHLRSGLLPPEHSTTICYRDKNYDSASAALDAYIADFEMSHQNSGLQTVRMAVPRSPPAMPSRHSVNSLRNKDVLRESLTDRELDFLNLPVSSLCHHDNRDRLSMTTNELLSIPYDGSMPVTHTSAFIQGLLWQTDVLQPRCSSSRTGQRSGAALRRSQTTPQLNLHNCHLVKTPKNSKCSGRPDGATYKTLDDKVSVRSFKCARRAAEPEWAKPSSMLHLPQWFTSNKADMNCSEMTSVQDLKYPAWIQHCDLSDLSLPPESELLDNHAPRTRAPSWVAELEDDDDPKETWSQADSQQMLRDLRLQFAQQISLLTAERKDTGILETLFRDNRIESLIQKADEVLSSLSQSSGPADLGDTASQVNKEEPLLSSTSCCPPVSLGSAAAAGGVTDSLTGSGAQALCCSLSGDSTWKQPGPVEALKQMLFRLQAVEAHLQQQQKAPVAPTLSDRLHTEETPVNQERPDSEAELEGFSGGPSLQRALHHLRRLKLLVEEPRVKLRKDEEEEGKDDDEGRYSYTSADGLTCSQQKPC